MLDQHMCIRHKTKLRSDYQYSHLNFMSMNGLLLKGKLFSLLSESSQVTNQEIQNAYGCFMEQVTTISQSEQNYSEFFRILNITRIELISIESHYQYGQGEKCA